tara:strand:- start:835 stop:1509 length:675 start_codon:yes stop_codon:yes gene_type:complete
MTPLWINDISVLYNGNYLFEIVPNKGFDFNRKLNSLVRLSIYYSVIMFLVNKDTNVFFIPAVVLALSVVLNKNHAKTQIEESTNNLKMDEIKVMDSDMDVISSSCRIPTDENPFMNPLQTTDNPNLKSCSSYNNKGIQRDIDDKFNTDLYRDANDIFGKNNSQRQFYTVPGGSIPNDQEAFTKWLYQTPPTCKEGNGAQCFANVDGGPGRMGQGGPGSSGPHNP